MYRRESITILGRAVNNILEKDGHDTNCTSISGQKSEVKIIILNLIKLTTKFLIGHFLVKSLYGKAQSVTDFLPILKLYQN